MARRAVCWCAKAWKHLHTSISCIGSMMKCYLVYTHSIPWKKLEYESHFLIENECTHKAIVAKNKNFVNKKWCRLHGHHKHEHTHKLALKNMCWKYKLNNRRQASRTASVSVPIGRHRTVAAETRSQGVCCVRASLAFHYNLLRPFMFSSQVFTSYR